MKKLSAILTMFLCLAVLCACGDKDTADGGSVSTDTLPSLWETAAYTEDTSLGEGAKTVVVQVTAEGYSIELTLKTDADTLGEALLTHGLIAGEEGQYGLYIKEVNGILADYDVDQTYWGFYQNGEYMLSGVDGTKINGGEHFELVRTK